MANISSYHGSFTIERSKESIFVMNEFLDQKAKEYYSINALFNEEKSDNNNAHYDIYGMGKWSAFNSLSCFFNSIDYSLINDQLYGKSQPHKHIADNGIKDWDCTIYFEIWDYEPGLCFIEHFVGSMKPIKDKDGDGVITQIDIDDRDNIEYNAENLNMYFANEEIFVDTTPYGLNLIREEIDIDYNNAIDSNQQKNKTIYSYIINSSDDELKGLINHIYDGYCGYMSELYGSIFYDDRKEVINYIHDHTYTT